MPRSGRRYVVTRRDSEANTKHEISIWASIRRNSGRITLITLKAYCLIDLTLFATEVLRSSLDPVYGSIPASRYHGSVTLLALLAACSTYTFWRGSSYSWARTLAVAAMAASTIQIYLYRYSGKMGPSSGPLVTALLTTFPVTLISGMAAAKGLASSIGQVLLTDKSQKNRVSSGMIAYILNAAVFLTAYLEPKIGSILLSNWLRIQVVYSRVGLYYLLTIFYALLYPSGYLVFLIIPLFQTTLFSAYITFSYPNEMLNITLQKHGYSLVARQESNTGYISVLDNVKDGFRVMRCDHSLLGGEWIPPPGYVTRVHEPIYAVFVMLEAVRLVVPESSKTEKQQATQDENALVIGLGIGTTPSALIAHGISTTIVEIDPVVHAFATQYFHLPINHTSVIQDAVPFVSESQSQSHDRREYDYIIHDVFTGGVEPIALFTSEFLQGLKELLKPEGVIAINYAGDILLPSATSVILTVLTVFPSCRLFREEEEAAPPPPSSNSPTDFTNLVMFCLKSTGSFTFREPGKGDFLGSQAREHHLLPRHEVGAAVFLDRVKDSGDRGKVVTRGNMRELEKGQMESALGHWKVMRSVLPDVVWENW